MTNSRNCLSSRVSKTTTTKTTCVEKCTPYPEPRKVQSRNVFGSSEISFVWFSLKGLIFFFSPIFVSFIPSLVLLSLLQRRRIAMTRQGLISLVSLAICCSGLYDCFQLELPPGLVKEAISILDECFLDIDNNLYFTNHSHPN